MRLLLLAVVLAGPCVAQPTRASGDAVGCYRLDRAPWPEGLDHLPTPDRIPDRLELTPDPYLIGASRPGRPVERIPPPGLEGAHAVRYAGLPADAGPFAFWLVEDGRLVLNRYLRTSGFVGVATRTGDD